MQMRLLALAGMGAVLLASTMPEIWNKDFTSWTVEDAQQIMTRSPWAKERPMPLSERPGVAYVDLDPVVSASAPPSAELGNIPADRNGPPPTARTPSLGSAPVGAPQSPPVLKVIWASALPVRLAVLKLRSAKSGPTAEQLAHVKNDWPKYVVAVVGLAPPEAGSDPKALAGGAFLFIPGKPPARAIDSDYRRIGSADVYFFRFLKTALPITRADGDVEFRVTMGGTKLSQKFHLAEMEYEGRLAL